MFHKEQWLWKPTEPDDVLRVRLVPQMAATDERSNWDMSNAEVKKMLHESCRTWWSEAEPVAVIGLQPYWTGMATAFTLLSEESLTRPVALVRGCMDWLETAADAFGLHRVQATARLDQPRARRMLSWLGFEREGVMRRYGPDRADHVLYARLWDE